MTPQTKDYMLRLAALMAFLNFSLLTYSQRSAHQSQQMRIEAMVEKDSATLDKILAEELTYLHSNGLLETKRDFIKSITTHKLIYKQINIEKWQIRRTGRIAIIQGTVDVKGALNGNSFDVKLRYISVYKKIRGRWKLIAWQSLKADT